MQVRDWYVESFAELRRFPTIKDAADEAKFTELLKQIYQRHRSAAHPILQQETLPQILHQSHIIGLTNASSTYLYSVRQPCL